MPLQELRLFWKEVKEKCEFNELPSVTFWNRLAAYVRLKERQLGFFNKHWAGRAQEFRLLVEPLDIVNWYIKNKHCGKNGEHYVEGSKNGTVDNNKRPGIYLFLQQLEKQVTQDYPMTSHAKADYYQARLGQHPWPATEWQWEELL